MWLTDLPNDKWIYAVYPIQPFQGVRRQLMWCQMYMKFTSISEKKIIKFWHHICLVLCCLCICKLAAEEVLVFVQRSSVVGVICSMNIWYEIKAHFKLVVRFKETNVTKDPPKNIQAQKWNVLKNSIVDFTLVACLTQSTLSCHTCELAFKFRDFRVYQN